MNHVSPLSPQERRELRIQAHHLHPVVIIGETGLRPTVLKEIHASLAAHGLIKIRIPGDDRARRIALSESICAECNAHCIQSIGKLLIIYRPKEKIIPVKKSTTADAQKTRRGLASVKKKPLQKNQRLTQGGLIKRAKPRQKSLKKAAMSAH